MYRYQISNTISDVTMGIRESNEQIYNIYSIEKYKYRSCFNWQTGRRSTKAYLRMIIHHDDLRGAEIKDLFSSGKIDVCLQYPELSRADFSQDFKNNIDLCPIMNKIWYEFACDQQRNRQLSLGRFLLELKGTVGRIEYEYGAHRLNAR